MEKEQLKRLLEKSIKDLEVTKQIKYESYIKSQSTSDYASYTYNKGLQDAYKRVVTLMELEKLED